MGFLNGVKCACQLSSKPSLVIDKDLQLAPGKENVWESTGPNPSLMLEGYRLPLRWVQVSCLMSSQKTASLSVVIENGDSSVMERICRVGIATEKEERSSVYLHLHSETARLRLVVEPAPKSFCIRDLTVTKVLWPEILAKNLFRLTTNGKINFEAFRAVVASFSRIIRENGFEGFLHYMAHLSGKVMPNVVRNKPYELWMRSHDPSVSGLEKMGQDAKALSRKPVFSILTPVYNVDEKWLRSCLDSVLAQVYPYWEICLADDASTKPHVRAVLNEYAEKDKRIKVLYRRENGHISAATNSALSLASGEYVCLLDDDDKISPDALFEYAKYLSDHPETDMLYSDEDKIDINERRFDPFFKPDWSPEYLETCMYTGHFSCYKTEVVRQLGGFREGYEGSQDHDLALRFSERTDRIGHIPKVLYHWRAIPKSAALSSAVKSWYAMNSGVKALQDRLERLHVTGTVLSKNYSSFYSCRRDIVGNPLVSIVILSAGPIVKIGGRKADILANCIKSIREKSTYGNYEILVIHNADLRPDTMEVVSRAEGRLISFNEAFNFARQVNFGAKHANGEYLLLLNDDTEVITPDWIEILLQFCQRPGVGVAGARLYTDDGHVQHAGVSLLESGLPSHVYYGHPGTIPGYFFAITGNRNSLAVTAAAMMTSKTVFEEVGGFNGQFPLNYNDIDYCLKVYSTGRRIVYAAEAELFHYESKSKVKRAVSQQERELFLSLWGNGMKKDPYYSAHLDRKHLNYEINPE